jgi:glycosyltransferase involved in cell wall biosynthesis
MLGKGSTIDRIAAFSRASVRRFSDLSKISRADIVFVHREAFPVGPPWFERRVFRSGRKLVYDFDDAVHIVKPDATYPGLNWLRNPEKVGRIIRWSSLTIAGNETLAEYARAQGKKVKGGLENPYIREGGHSCPPRPGGLENPPSKVLVLPTPVDTEMFKPPESRAGIDRTVIGWIGGPKGVPSLDFLRPVFRDLSKKHSFRVHVVGDRWECPGVEVRSEKWEQGRDVADLQGFDIGLMPLTDTPWNRGKCSYKLLQYMSSGKAVVASPVGMNREVVRDGVNGFLADGPEEWREKLDRLLSERNLRDQMGLEGRRLAEDEYSLKALGPKFVEALKEVLE